MKIALISCVKTKRQTKSPAKDLYISTLFKLNYAYAKKTCDKVFILSAKYGLVEENTLIEPYEKTLNKMSIKERKEWSQAVLSSLKVYTNLEKDEFLILAGQRYREFLLKNIKNYKIPLKNLGLGRQLKNLKELL